MENVFFLIVGITTTVVGVLGLFFLKDKPGIKANNENYFKNIIYGFKPSTVKANKMLYVAFAAFCIFNIAYQVFMPYLIIYLEKNTRNRKLCNSARRNSCCFRRYFRFARRRYR
ncbi:MAG: hypothetical protein L6V88_00400 [Anaerotruncus sp.]|nr:MAG: hypothetical protein L6V88_00400 [Anaerotruncus sp.]